METSRSRSLARSIDPPGDAQFLVGVNSKAEVGAAIQQDIVRLGGKSTAEGYRFHTRSGRNIAARALEQRWGVGCVKSIDRPATKLKLVPVQKEARILVVGLGDANTRCWFESLANREFEVRLSTNGLHCSAELKRFQPNVLLIDEALLWGPRPNPASREFPPMRVALLRNEEWCRSNRLKLPTGRPLPAVIGPTSLDGILRNEFLLD